LADSFGRFEEAVELLRRAIALDPLNAAIRGSLAEICSILGRQEEAEAEFKKALELDPDLPPIHEGLGLLYLAQGRAQDALAEIERETNGYVALTRTGCRVLHTSSEEGVDTALNELIAKIPIAVSLPNCRGLCLSKGARPSF